MNRILIQLWEISYPDNSIESDGCSLHLDIESRNVYIKQNNTKSEQCVFIIMNIF